MDWRSPPPGFRFILFERVNQAENELRFYYLGWRAPRGACVQYSKDFQHKNGKEVELQADPTAGKADLAGRGPEQEPI